MKKKILVAVVVVVLIGAFIVFMSPTPMAFSAQSTRTFIQEDQEMEKESIHLSFEGAKSDMLLFGETFVGEMTIDETVFYGVEFRLGSEELLFGELESGDPVYIGEIYTDELLHKVAIISKELDEEGEPTGKGIIIAGPSTSRQEALELTKSLLEATESENIDLLK